MRFFVRRGWLAAAGIALGCLAAGEARPTQLGLTVTPLERDRTMLVWARDFEYSGLARVTFDADTRTLSFARGNVRLVMPLASRSARLNGIAVAVPVSVRVIAGRAMVPAQFVLDALGLSQVVVVPPSAARQSGGHSGTSISGRVLYAGAPLEGVVLRLVRADDFTFVPQLRVRTDTAGRYSFASVADGAYRVYAYVGDNPGYFNRVTGRLEVAGHPREAPDINMGRVLEARDPPSGAILSPGRQQVSRGLEFVFTWSPCPQAARYLLAVIDSATNEEVFSAVTTAAHVAVDLSRMRAGRRYEWRVTATDAAGAFLGGSPGAGGDAFTFTLAID